MSDLTRLLSKVEFDPFGGCWLFATAIYRDGYGSFWYAGRIRAAHRASWMIHHGDPGEAFVLHRCDVRPCVNPDHLFLGTFDENMADMATKGRSRHGLEHYNGRLSDDDVRAIRRRVETGEMQRDVADAFKVSSAYVSELCSRTKRAKVI